MFRVWAEHRSVAAAAAPWLSLSRRYHTSQSVVLRHSSVAVPSCDPAPLTRSRAVVSETSAESYGLHREARPVSHSSLKLDKLSSYSFVSDFGLPGHLVLMSLPEDSASL